MDQKDVLGKRDSDGPSAPVASSTPATAPVRPQTGPPAAASVPSGSAKTAPPATVAETPRERRARKAHRVRLYVYVVSALVLVAYLIALGVANTAAVEVSWVFGTASVALVWLVLSTAIIGMVLGLLISLLITWRTRRPHRQQDD